MTDERVAHRRRADFDELVRGWGSDVRDDLEARVTLVHDVTLGILGHKG